MKKCAKCGKTIEKTYFKVLDNHLQLKYFDSDEENCFCSQECFCDYVMLQEQYIEDEITEEMWNKAINNVKVCRSLACEIGFAGMFYITGCNEMLERYSKGERTLELYEEMIAVH